MNTTTVEHTMSLEMSIFGEDFEKCSPVAGQLVGDPTSLFADVDGEAPRIQVASITTALGLAEPTTAGADQSDDVPVVEGRADTDNEGGEVLVSTVEASIDIFFDDADRGDASTQAATASVHELDDGGLETEEAAADVPRSGKGETSFLSLTSIAATKRQSTSGDTRSLEVAMLGAELERL